MSADFKKQLLRSASLEQLRVTTSQTLIRLRREISDLRLLCNIINDDIFEVIVGQAKGCTELPKGSESVL
jgi:hypothetical protein